MKIFLSGAIQGLENSRFPFDWREQAQSFLSNYQTISSLTEWNKFELSVQEQVRRNLFLQKQCDLLLVEYTIPNRAYIGTDFELTKALEFQQPAIVWAHPSYTNRVYLQYMATVILPTLEECLDYIKAFYPSRRTS